MQHGHDDNAQWGKADVPGLTWKAEKHMTETTIKMVIFALEIDTKCQRLETLEGAVLRGNVVFSRSWWKGGGAHLLRETLQG